jgi:hypothetical protein
VTLTKTLTQKTKGYDDEVQVARHLKAGLDELEARASRLSTNTAEATARAERLLRQLGATVPSQPDSRRRAQAMPSAPLELRPWAELVSDAHGLDADVEALLSAADTQALWARLEATGASAVAEHAMDLADAAWSAPQFDWTPGAALRA